MPKYPDLRADITLACGQSGSGKSGYVKTQIASARRVIAWDVKGEYANLKGWRRVESSTELAQVLAVYTQAKIAFVPRALKQFDHWCKCAYAWGNCTVIAEELADVTSPGKAPEGWGWIVRRGRERGLVVFGITQRPAESDKTILGNVTRIRCCALQRADDRKYMARELDVPQTVLDGLQLDQLEYVEKDIYTRKIVRGSLKKSTQTPLRGGLAKA